jgi:hypothetical protein
MATKITGIIASIGMQNAMLGVTTDAGPSVMVKASEPQRQKMFPGMNIGDHIEIWVNEDKTIKGGIKILEHAKVPEVKSYPKTSEEKLLKELDRQDSILWQSCMKAAVELEKFYVGNAEDRVETCKNVLKMTNDLFEASQRKFRGLPPIPECADE